MSVGIEIKKLQTAGFSDEEIADWSALKRRELSAAGFNEAEIDTWFGQPPFDPKPVQDHFKANLQTSAQPAEGAQPKPVTSFMDALEAGLQVSVSGLLARGKAPSKVLAEDAPRSARIASNVASLAGDFPVMVGGFALGGGPVTGMAGAFALPMGMRRILMDKYERGEVSTWGDFWDRASGAIIDTAKGWITGAATGIAGKVAATLPIASPTVKAATTLSSEVGTMVTVGKALDGEIPNADDFIDAAILLGGLKGAARTSAKLRKIYAETGVKPEDVVQDVAKDPTIAADVASDNVDVPKAYRPMTKAEILAKSQGGAPEGANLADPNKFGEDPLGRLPADPVTSPRGELLPEQSENLLNRATVASDLVAQGEPGGRVFQDNPNGPGMDVTGYSSSYPDWYGPLNMKKSTVINALEKIKRDKGEDVGVGVEKVKEAILKDRDLDELVGEFPETGPAVTELRQVPPPPGETPPPKPPAAEPPPSGPTGDAQKAILDRIVQSDPVKKGVTWEGVYTQLVDNLNPIKLAEKEAGKPLSAGESPYQLERLTRGIFGKGVQFIKYGAFDFETYKTTGKGYEKILAPVAKDLDGFRAYMAGKRALELQQRGIESGMPLEAARQVVDAGRSKYEKVFQDRLKYRDAMLDYLHKSGILSAKSVAAMREANKAYVPFYRFFEEAESGRPTSSSKVRNPIKTIKGSERKILDPIESDIKDTFLFVALAEKNAARQAFVALGPDFAEKVKTPMRPIEVTEREVKAFMAEHGLEGDPAPFTIFRPSTFNPGKDEIVVFSDGKRQVYKVNPDVAEAFNAADKTSANFLANMLRAPASLLRAGVTLSPDFMVRNVVRDAISAFIYAGSHPIKTAKGAVSLVAKDTAFQNWMKAGGANATMVAMDRDYISAQLFALNAKTGVMERAINVAKTPVEILRVVSELIENATRLGSIRKDILTAKDKATMQGLAMISREATVDFSRHGASEGFREYTRLTAFMNPGIQGIDRMFRAFHDNPAGTLAKSLMAITIPSLYLWWANHDDERWNEIPRWQKDLFWIVLTKDHIYRIPKPFEIGVMFGSVPERLLERYVAENPDGLKDLEETMMQAFGINAIPTVVTPVIEQFANRSMFTGQPLIPANAEGLLPEYQYTEYTSEATKALAQLIGSFPGLTKRAIQDEDTFLGGTARALSTPVLIENYLHAWTGGLGIYTLKIADKALREAGELPDPVTPTPTLADLPVVKAFMVRYPSASAQSIQDFYDAYAAKRRVYDTALAKAKEGDSAAFERALSFDESALGDLGELRTALTEHSQIIRLIHKNPDIPADEQRQLIDTLYGRMIELAKHGNEALRAVERELVGERR